MNIFAKIGNGINWKVTHHQHGLYVYIVFPIMTSFLITFIGSRIISHLAPNLYIPWAGIHVHHFAYGFFILAIAGYLALVFSGPRAKYLIAFLHGIGLGLAFDEFGIWLHLEDTNPARWSYDGFLIIIGATFMLVTAKPGIEMLKRHFPFRGSMDSPGA